MAPLFSLRQACCHPQLVKGGYLPFSSISKRSATQPLLILLLLVILHMFPILFYSFMTMEELLKKLGVQAKQEGRECLRMLVMSINGLAGVHILNKEVLTHIVTVLC